MTKLFDNSIALNDTLNAVLNNISTSNINISMSANTSLTSSARLPATPSVLNSIYKL